MVTYKDTLVRKKGRINHTLVFLILLIGIACYYDYHNILFKKPQSVHNWRQSDCASLTLNYYQNGMKFFQPETHNLTSRGFTSGKAATSEIPILYYTIAILYKIFGYHDYIYRILNTLIYLSGIFALFRIFTKLKIDIIWSLAFSLLFFASPVLVYYGNNYLTDVTALSFSFIAWNYFLSYYQKMQIKYYWISMGFFFLAVSMKISAGLSVVALVCMYLFELTGFIKFKDNQGLFPKRIPQLIPFLLIFIVVFGWAYYARIYNTRNDCIYFSTQTFPIWNMSESFISETISNIKKLWLNDYFHIFTQLMFGVLLITNIFLHKKTSALLLTLNLLLLAGCFVFLILWFEILRNHDYYAVNLYILPAITALTFSEIVNRKFPKIAKNYLVRGLLLFVLVFNVYHTKSQLQIRYDGWWNEYTAYKDFYSVTSYLRSIGITRHDTVVSIPDQSHHTLYLMNQPGWTECFGLNKDSAAIEKSISRGAKYLIVSSTREIDSRKYLQKFTHDLVGNYNEIVIYRLTP
jgi:hypothetical protein